MVAWYLAIGGAITAYLLKTTSTGRRLLRARDPMETIFVAVFLTLLWLPMVV